MADQERSIAPLEDGTHECPRCHRYTAFFDRARRANVCLNRTCDYYEQITPDNIPRMFTEVEMRRIAREEAIKVNREFRGGDPMMRFKGE